MDQHFLSRFYLSGFCDPDVPAGHTPFVWTQTLQQSVWRRKSPKKLATTPDLYTFSKADGTKDQSLEELLGKIETVVAPVIKRISSGASSILETERQNLALFVALAQLRVPAMHDNIGDFIGRVGEGLIDILHHQFTNDPKAFQHYKKLKGTDLFSLAVSHRIGLPLVRRKIIPRFGDCHSRRIKR